MTTTTKHRHNRQQREIYAREICDRDPFIRINDVAAQLRGKFQIGLDTRCIARIRDEARAAKGLPPGKKCPHRKRSRAELGADAYQRTGAETPVDPSGAPFQLRLIPGKAPEPPKDATARPLEARIRAFCSAFRTEFPELEELRLAVGGTGIIVRAVERRESRLVISDEGADQ